MNRDLLEAIPVIYVVGYPELGNLSCQMVYNRFCARMIELFPETEFRWN